jgi:HD superfamily phosphohydrolase
VEIGDWERDIINHPVFQRLRRIRQLAFAEHLYPGAVHTRFEHSLGVMHVATRIFDALMSRHDSLLRDRLRIDPKNSNARSLVRLAALLHDVGHSPFSHTTEELLPLGEDGKQLRHEHVTSSFVSHEMRDVIDEHPDNKQQFNITGEAISDFYLGKARLGHERLFWKELVNGQLDADRMDYLLRDAHHCGVSYGMFDLGRIIDTITLVETGDDDRPGSLRIGIESNGRHAAEGLFIARYFMSQQVYFHPVRKAYDYHAKEATRLMLQQTGGQGVLPDPQTSKGRSEFLGLDDWSVLSSLREQYQARHGRALLNHLHDRCLLMTRETASISEILRFEEKLNALIDAGIDAWSTSADKEWYDQDSGAEIQIVESEADGKVSAPAPLSTISNVVHKITKSRQRLLFVPHDQVSAAIKILNETKGN